MKLKNITKKLRKPGSTITALKHRLIKDGPVIMKWDGQLFCGHPKSQYDAALIYRKEMWEPKVTGMYIDYLKSNMTVLDVGARRGYYTLLAAKRVGPGGRVLSFEPIRDNYHSAKVNVHVNRYDNVSIFNVALFSCEEESQIDKISMGVCRGGKKGTNSEKIKLIKGDDIIFSDKTGVNRVDLIKIDIEGAELDALIGLKKTILKYHPVIFIEVHTILFKNFNRSFADLIDFLNKIDYIYKPIDLGPSEFEEVLTGDPSKESRNFHLLCTPN